MTSKIRGLETGIRNANDAISMVSTPEGARSKSPICCNACGAGAAGFQRHDYPADHYLSSEANFPAEIDRIAENTQWNGKTILNHITTARDFRSGWAKVARLLPSTLEI
ncbi:MAG: hypothetical protein CM15mP74_10900 [Halieaceae bacterium]|nr:MAG: hypothetical protein CM15mP74_10900 [Halieaceae bacterium]